MPPFPWRCPGELVRPSGAGQTLSQVGHLVVCDVHLVPLMESGAIDPPIGSVFALDDAAAAIRAMDERRAVGRLLVRIRQSEIVHT